MSVYSLKSSFLRSYRHILWDLIEDLGIGLQVTEDSIREEIDGSRSKLGLEPLPLFEKKAHKRDNFLQDYFTWVSYPAEIT